MQSCGNGENLVCQPINDRRRTIMGIVEYELDDHIAVIILNRPERLNAVGPDMRAELTKAFAMFNDDDEAWVAILAGRGRAFCAGRDLKAHAEGIANNSAQSGAGREYTSENNMLGVSDTKKPMIAAIHGFAMGLGWYMSMACDIRVAADGTQFGLTEVNTGVLGPYWLAGAELMPWSLAAELALLGERVKAERLYQLGLLNAVVPEADLMSEARAWAEKFVRLPPQHVQTTKALMLETRLMPGPEMQARERAVRGQLSQLADTREAVLAFTEKREPRFTGN
jgi:enoyl-CoA hydratase/carnithine racemase